MIAHTKESGILNLFFTLVDSPITCVVQLGWLSLHYLKSNKFESDLYYTHLKSNRVCKLDGPIAMTKNIYKYMKGPNFLIELLFEILKTFYDLDSERYFFKEIFDGNN